MTAQELTKINRQRDEMVSRQTEGPDGLMYPILSLCCAYAESGRVHAACRQRLCECPCHAAGNSI